MKQRTSQIIYGYWNDVRRGRLAPRRFDIEPARLAPILAETLILERMDRGEYKFRLAGTRICDQLATELRGRDFLSLWNEDDRAAISDLLGRIADQGGVAVLEFEAASGHGKSARFEAILLPLTHNRQVIDRYLGAISCFSHETWIGSEPLTQFVLMSGDVIWPDGRPHGLIERQHHQAPFLPELTRGRLVRVDRRQFRVLDGGRSEEGKGKA